MRSDKYNVPESMNLGDGVVEVPESAMKKLDALIHTLYADSLWWKINPEGWVEDVEGCDKSRAKKAKEVAKAFGLFPYNQDEVRNP